MLSQKPARVFCFNPHLDSHVQSMLHSIKVQIRHCWIWLRRKCYSQYYARTKAKSFALQINEKRSSQLQRHAPQQKMALRSFSLRYFDIFISVEPLSVTWRQYPEWKNKHSTRVFKQARIFTNLLSPWPWIPSDIVRSWNHNRKPQLRFNDHFFVSLMETLAKTRAPFLPLKHSRPVYSRANIFPNEARS